MQERKFFVGVDIGGTFTDVILAEEDTQHLYTAKVLTTPQEPSKGVLTGIEDALAKAGAKPQGVERVVHATTLATNLILERKGSTVGYIATKGFADSIVIGRDRRIEADRYDLFYEKPAPLVPRRLTAEVDERMNFRGEVVVPLDETQAAAAVQKLAKADLDAVAICFLHSYANPDHERRVAEIVRRYMPNAYVSLSSEVWPEFREYDRASTTVMSAYVGPVMAAYVDRLEREIRELGIDGSFQIMQSNGGVMSVATAATSPIYSVESGPAAGVIAAAHLGERFGEKNIISFDMGGTTAKAGLIRDSKPNITHDFHVGGKANIGGRRNSGFPIKTPVIDLAEVGAGGGSIAWVDSGGVLQVGPKSAGANPGPACYGFGGDQPTVTDANLVLGFLNPDYFLGGGMTIYPEKSREAIERHVSGPLRMDLTAAAAGIFEIVNANMASAVRVVTVQRGIDPREYALIAFGGAGPAHIVKVAEQFDIPTVIVPVTPGLTSAVGLLVSDMTYDYVRTRLMEEEANLDEINTMFRDLESQGLEHMSREGIAREDIHLQRQIDLRFKFQSHELSVPVHAGTITSEDIATASQAFQDLYFELYGIRQSSPTQLVNYRVRAVGIVPKVELSAAEVTGGDPSHALKDTRQVYFKESGGFLPTTVYDRLRLLPGDAIAGPAVTEEPDSTIVIPPQYSGTVDPYRNVVIRRD